MESRILLLLSLLVITACNRTLRGHLSPTEPSQLNPSFSQAGSFEGQITSGGVTRHYLLHVPTGYRSGNAVSLILNFHGFGSNSQQEENLTGMSAKADREGFIAVYPDGIDSTWFTGPGEEGQQDMQFIRDLIASLESQYNIDPKQIYAAGSRTVSAVTWQTSSPQLRLIQARTIFGRIAIHQDQCLCLPFMDWTITSCRIMAALQR